MGVNGGRLGVSPVAGQGTGGEESVGGGRERGGRGGEGGEKEVVVGESHEGAEGAKGVSLFRERPGGDPGCRGVFLTY
jgi:hypothetical protein